MTKRTAPGPASGGSDPRNRSARALAVRLAALEERVARLETGRPPPGDGRTAQVRKKVERRCPGCGLPLRRLRGRCAGCGRPLD